MIWISFLDKNTDVKRFLATNMESLANSIKNNIDHKNLGHFHEFLCGYKVFLSITPML